MDKVQKIILFLIIAVAFALRLYNLSDIPSGLHADEASQGFNAFSILKTGKDMYGKSFPILFRANGSYQPPVYTYLAIIPTIFLGNSIMTVKSVSALSGVGLVLLTFLLISRFGGNNKKERTVLGLIAAGTVAISPWSINFSRFAVEANPGVLIFGIGVFLLLASLERKALFPVAALVLGISTHAYYSERVVAVLLLAIFVFLNRKIYLKVKKTLVLGLGIFGLVLLPHFLLLATGALTKRLTEVSYLGHFNQGSGFLADIFEIAKQFINHDLIYYSPKNLFFDPGNNLGRSAPGLGAFYPWMIVFFLIGVGYLFKNRQAIVTKVVAILLVIAPIPAALTGNSFYPLRTLDYLWIVSIVISYGSFEVWKRIKNNWIRFLIIFGVVSYSLFTFGLSYFVIYKYDSANVSGKPYMELMPLLARYPDKEIRVDFSGRSWGVGIRATYLAAVGPKIVQANLVPQMNSIYYSPVVSAQEIFRVGNISFEPLDWTRVCGKDLIIVGDELSFDPNLMGQHELKLLFTVPDYLNKPILFGYSTAKLCK